MTVRAKTFLAIGISVFLLTLAAMALSDWGLRREGRAAENQMMRREMARTLAALSQELLRLDMSVRDYASWDDTCKFMEDRNEGYIHSNLLYETFENNHLNIVVFISNDGDMVYGSRADYSKKCLEPLSDGFLEDACLKQCIGSIQKTEDVRNGFLKLPDGEYLAVFRPILSSGFSGPPRGVLLFARAFNQNVVTTLESLTDLTLNIRVPETFASAEDFLEGVHDDGSPFPVSVYAKDNDTIAAKTLIKDLCGQALYCLEASAPRHLNQEFLTVRQFVLGSILAISAVLAAVVLLLFERVILSRLSRLRRFTSAIETTRNWSDRVQISGKDEISDLASHLNGMLERLEEDIAARQQAARELQETASRLEYILDVTKTSVDIIDAKYNVRYLDFALLKKFGDPTEKKCHEVFKGTGTPCNECNVSKAFATKEMFISEETLSQEDRDIEVHTIPFQDPDGEWLVAEFSLDITERKRSEKALLASETKYRDLVEGVSSVILRIDTKGEITFSNRYAQEFFGYSKEEFSGKDILDTLAPPPGSAGWSDLELEKLRFQQSEGDDVTYEIENILKDGEHVWIAWTIKALRDGNENVREYLCVGNDITELRRTQIQLRQSQKMEAVGQLAGGIAHEFNNALQIILGNTEMLSEAALQGEEVEMLRHIRATAARAANLTQQLLSFSKQNALDLQPVEVNEFVRDAVRKMQDYFGDRIHWRISEGELHGAIAADRNQLEQTIKNLCLNAYDAMSGEGDLHIATDTAVFDALFCEQHAWARPGRFISIRVSDSGMGIPPEIMPRIFEPFFTTKEVGKGAGLGLSMIFGMIQQHNGLIETSSVVGRGASFIVYFPEIQRTAPKPASTLPASMPGGSATLLFAEDEIQVRSFATQVLKRAGYRLFVAEDGEDALRLYREHTNEIDGLILDVVMPKLGGVGVYKTICLERPDIPCLFCSGFSEDTFHEGTALEGNAHLLKKPYRLKELLQEVRNMLDTKPS